ncbi:hypothetical protein D3C84_539960 [compost metagenome]
MPTEVTQHIGLWNTSQGNAVVENADFDRIRAPLTSLPAERWPLPVDRDGRPRRDRGGHIHCKNSVRPAGIENTSAAAIRNALLTAEFVVTGNQRCREIYAPRPPNYQCVEIRGLIAFKVKVKSCTGIPVAIHLNDPSCLDG